jgi:hypothetical protein
MGGGGGALAGTRTNNGRGRGGGGGGGNRPSAYAASPCYVFVAAARLAVSEALTQERPRRTPFPGQAARAARGTKHAHSGAGRGLVGAGPGELPFLLKKKIAYERRIEMI